MNKENFLGLSLLFFVAVFIVLSANFALAGDGMSVMELKKKGLKSPAQYGSIVLNNKTGEGKAMPAVVFPHWWHRTQFTCKVCHQELGFPLKAGETDFVMSEIFAGKQCGACHNGTTAFKPFDCARCHSSGQKVPQNRDISEVLKDLPKSDFGNKVDWVKAIDSGKIKPKASLDGKGEMAVLDLNIDIPVTKFLPSPPDVVYPHKAHTQWLDCSNCHSAIFNMQKGGNPDMSMMKIISGQYCGVCHGKVAFPLENCFRCHSGPPKFSEELYQKVPERLKKKVRDQYKGKRHRPKEKE